MAADVGDGGGRSTESRRGRRWPVVLVWQFGVLVAATAAGAAYLSGECGAKGGRTSGRSTLARQGGAVQSVAFDAGGRRIGSVGADGSVVVWDLRDGLARPMPPVDPEQGHCAAFSPDGRLLAVGRAGGAVVVHDLRAEEEQALIDPSGTTVRAACLAFAPDGRTLAVGRRDGWISLWDAATLRARSEWPGHAEVVRSLTYSPDGRTLASSGGDRTVRLWDPATGRERRSIPEQPGMFVGLAFSPDSRVLALADRLSRIVRLWDLARGVEATALRGAEAAVLAVAISPDGQTLAAADFGGAVHSWRLATGRLDRAVLLHPGVQTLAFAPDGRTLATGGFDGIVHLWDWPPPESEGD